jgi:F-type H+-transporting ATPase subunit delta
MVDARIGRRYAQALFNTAKAHMMVAAVEEDLNGIANLLREDTTFRHFLILPTTGSEEKTAILERIFGDRITSLTMQVLRVMLEKGREAEIETVTAEFSRLRRESAEIELATITTAYPLDPDQKEAILAGLQKRLHKIVEAKFIVDPRVIGGVRVAYGSFVLDGSARGHLNRLRERLHHDVLKQA